MGVRRRDEWALGAEGAAEEAEGEFTAAGWLVGLKRQGCVVWAGDVLTREGI